MSEMTWMTVRCQCGRKIPVTVARWIVVASRGKPPETAVLTYGCRSCGIVTARVSDLQDRRVA